MFIDYDGTILFGKVYRGEKVQDVDSSFLEWMLSDKHSLKFTSREVALIITERLRRETTGGKSENQYRRAHNRPEVPRVPAGVTPGILLEFAAAGRQGCAKKHHPDVGGSHEMMLAVNAIADELETQARQLQGANQ